MHSKTLITTAAFALCAAIVDAQDTANEPAVEASDIEAVIPTEIISPAEATSIANVGNSFIASVTAAPEFSSVISVLSTAIPITAQAEIAADPQGYLLDIIQGSPPPAWATALPPSVGQYVESVAQDAAQIVSSDFPDLYTSISDEVSALETGAPIVGGYVAPTGGYSGTNYTLPRPSGSGVAPGPTPEPFVPGSGASANGGSVLFAVMAATFGLGQVNATDMQATTNTATITSPTTTTTEFACLPSTVTSTTPSISVPSISISSPTAVPTPHVNGTAQALINEIRTALLYAELIGNDGNLPKLCSVIDPVALFNEIGINGTMVQLEVCKSMVQKS
ncbi:MAG: hypothetical protein Q9213_002503 [Squamulea squamosa]